MRDLSQCFRLFVITIVLIVLSLISTSAQEDSIALYDTLVSFEHYDTERTHRFPDAEFLGSFDGENTVAQQQFEGLYPSIYNIVTREEGELFAYGGSYGDQPDSTGAFIARLDTETYTEVWRTVLINTDETGDWNYPGVVSVLGNGDLYVIYGYQIARLDAATGDIIQREMLPSLTQPRNTAYNGFNLLKDGTIVAKAVYRPEGCEVQGFSAFLQCTDQLNEVPASIMVAIDPETLTVFAEITMPELAGGRITTTQFNGTEYIYHTGVENVFRYRFDGEAFILDEEWGFVPYLNEGQANASAIAVMNDWVVFQTNAGPAAAPLSVVAISQADGSQTHRIDPFADSNTFFSFIPAMLSVDPENNRVYTQDAGARRVAALDFEPEMGFTIAWSVEQTTIHFTTIVGPPNARVLVATDRPPINFIRLITGRGNPVEEVVIWRNAETGDELARSGPLPRMTSGVLVTPGYDGRYYYPGLDGVLYEITVEADEL